MSLLGIVMRSDDLKSIIGMKSINWNEIDYWIAVRGFAKEAISALGTGPVADFVHQSQVSPPVARSPDNEKVQVYIKEQVEYSSWMITKQHIVLLCTKNPSNVASQSMQEDVCSICRLFLKPIYYRLRFSLRLVVAPDFDDIDSDNYDSPMQWDNLDETVNAMVKLQSQYKQAHLPMPMIEIVAFNREHQEIRK